MAVSRIKQKPKAEKVKTSRRGVREGHGGGQRTLKMVQPLCAECQADIKHPLWWKLCTHNVDNSIYYTITPGKVERLPIVQEQDGRRVITGYEEVIGEDIKTLNLVQVPMGVRVKSGKALGDARYWGYKDLGDFNVRMMCEYRDCWEQPDSLLETPYGRFCSANQARLVGADVEEIVLEVFDEKKRKAQLRAIDLEFIDESDRV